MTGIEISVEYIIDHIALYIPNSLCGIYPVLAKSLEHLIVSIGSTEQIDAS